MGRDFRPKGKGARKAPPAQRDASDDDEHNVADDVLLREVQALGGNKDDVALMQSKGGSGPKLSVRVVTDAGRPALVGARCIYAAGEHGSAWEGEA